MLLCQVIAAEATVKKEAKDKLTEAYKAAQKPALFKGSTRTFEKINDDAPDLPSESVNVQLTVGEIFEGILPHVADWIDCTATKDYGNHAATADVVVDGQTVLESAPVPFLLYLEKQLLTDLRTLIEHLPTLATSLSWQMDDDAQLYRSETVRTHRTAKVQKPIVLYEATTEHPAQTQMITEDELVGYWATTELSGAISAKRKSELLRRLMRLQIAVKEAREQANATKIERKEAAKRIIEYIIGTS